MKTKEQYRHEVEEIFRRDRENCLASYDRLSREAVDRITEDLEAQHAKYLRDWSAMYDHLADASAIRHALALVLVRLGRVEDDVSDLEDGCVEEALRKLAVLFRAYDIKFDLRNEVDDLQCGPEPKGPFDV